MVWIQAPLNMAVKRGASSHTYPLLIAFDACTYIATMAPAATTNSATFLSNLSKPSGNQFMFVLLVQLRPLHRMYGLIGGFLKLNKLGACRIWIANPVLWRACWSKSKPQSPVPSLGSHWCGTVGNAACKNVLIKPTAMGAMVKSLLHAHRRTRAHKECMCIKKSPVIEQGLCVWGRQSWKCGVALERTELRLADVMHRCSE